MSNTTGHIPKNNSMYNKHYNQDADRYPLLKSTEPRHTFDKFMNHLTVAKLTGDDLAAMENFWEAVNSALMITLKSNHLLPEYRNLKLLFDTKLLLIPPQGHPYCDEIALAYNQFSRVLRDFLFNPSTIKQIESPNVYRTLLSNKLERDGFHLLWLIISKNSPQLGGHDRDLQEFVKTLEVHDGEDVTEFYERALIMSNEINLQEDKTGQHNRLIYRFVTLLSEFIDYKPLLRDVQKDLQRFFRQQDHHLLTFPQSLKDMR